MTRSSRSSAGCASRASAVRPESGAPCASRAVTSSTATPALSRASLPVTCQCSPSCRCTRPTSCSNCRPALYELVVSTPPKVEIAARTSTPFTAKTMPKNATSHCNTARPVKMRACFCLACGAACIGSVTSWSEKVVAHFGDLSGIRVDQLEQHRSRRRWRSRAVVGQHDTYFLGLVGADRDQLAAVGALRLAHKIDERRRQTVNADNELTIFKLFVDDADGVAVAQRTVGQPHEHRIAVVNDADALAVARRQREDHDAAGDRDHRGIERRAQAHQFDEGLLALHAALDVDVGVIGDEPGGAADF